MRTFGTLVDYLLRYLLKQTLACKNLLKFVAANVGVESAITQLNVECALLVQKELVLQMTRNGCYRESTVCEQLWYEIDNSDCLYIIIL